MSVRFTQLSRKRSVLILLFLLFIGIAVWLFPRGLGFYFQVKGGTILRSAYNLEQKNGFFACDPQNLKINQNLVTTATAYLEKAARLNPRLSQVQLLLGRCYCLSGQLGKARKSFTRYISQRPGNPLGYLELGFLYASKGNPAAARQVWSQAGINSNDLVNAGNQVSKSSLPEGKVWFERALWLDPQSTLAWIGLGKIYTQDGHNDMALNAFEQARKINPDLGTKPLADLLTSQGKYQQADTVLQAALSQFPDSIHRREWWITLGSSLETQGKWKDALRAYQDAVVDFPADAELLIRLGWAYVNGDGDSSSAREAFLQAVELDKRSGEGYVALGQLSSKAGNYHEAEDWFRQALARSPNSYWYQLYLANSTRDAGEIAVAIQMYQDLEARFPNYPSTWFNLAWAYRKNGEKVGAIQAVEKYSSLLEEPTDISYARVADFYEWAGEFQKALDAYRQSLALNPDNQNTAEKINRLLSMFNFDRSDGQNQP